MRSRMSTVVCTALCVLSLGVAATLQDSASAAGSSVTANPVPIPAGAIQVAWQGERVRDIQVYSGNQNDAVWLANQFNGSGWAYTFAGEMLVVPPSGNFILADFQPASGFPWPGTMGPNSPFPRAAITLLQVQLVPATRNSPAGMWIAVEIQGGDIDVAFDQYLSVTYSYNPGS